MSRRSVLCCTTTFPPSVWEKLAHAGTGTPGDRHGALAERAIKPLIPEENDFPYAMRVVSDILESNGSSSMASVCSASLSLMDAGVPIAKACAGTAMGLIKEGDQVAVLTDIQGLEDHYGDMDFKVAGTAEGVTALQMDNKAGGITRQILQQALDRLKMPDCTFWESWTRPLILPGRAFRTTLPGLPPS